MSTTGVMDTSGSRRRPYRTWPASLKREIVEASLAPGASASVVARRYDVNTNQLFRWRKQYREGLLGPAAPSGPALVPVRITPEPGACAATSGDGAGRVEIELAGGYRVRIGSGVDGGLLRLVLDVLERR